MKPRDFSQVPVEQLARLLLEQAQHDPGLPRRSPANSNEAPIGWRQPQLAQPCQPWFPERLADQPRFAGQDRIADLVSQAITVAQEAECLALATRDTSRRAHRGAAIAMALGTLGAIAGMSAGLGGLLSGDSRPPMHIAVQVSPAAQPVATPVAAINVQDGASQAADDTSGAAEAAAAVPLPALAPATFVRVLPAVPSPPSLHGETGWVAPSRSQTLSPGEGFGRVLGALRQVHDG